MKDKKADILFHMIGMKKEIRQELINGYPTKYIIKYSCVFDGITYSMIFDGVKKQVYLETSGIKLDNKKITDYVDAMDLELAKYRKLKELGWLKDDATVEKEVKEYLKTGLYSHV